MSYTRSRSAVAYVLLGIAMVWSQAAPECGAADAAPAAKEASKAKGRIPNYYSKVIDGQQRDKIYQIQQTYDPQIQQLQAQLKTLNDKRDAEIDALLTPAQREKVAALINESKQAAAKKKAAAAATNAKSAANSTSTSGAVPAK